jgi:DNA-binding LacI/PurR family transcriptional regulator
MSQPPLTTIAQPIHEIGRRAAMAILDPRPSIVRETLDLSLTVRGSTGPVSSS